jgi:hypothetical protein
MLPYPHFWPRHPTKEQELDYRVSTEPYKFFESKSDSDSASKFALDFPNNRNVNVSYRYSAFTAAKDPLYTSLYCDSSISWMSNQITARLKGVHPEGKDIVVPAETILSVADSYAHNGKYTDLELIKQQVVMMIVEHVINDFESTKVNNNLSVWNSIFTDDKGLTRKNDIKLNNRRRTPFYSWNY